MIEEVVIRKEAQDRTETVRDTVRRQEVHVDESGQERAVNQQGYDAFDQDYRRHFQTNYREGGQTYDQYTPVYRYGYTLANDQRYRNSDWTTVEPEARTHWESSNPNTWDEFKDTIRYAWERARGRS